jgi:hypothetical protein
MKWILFPGLIAALVCMAGSNTTTSTPAAAPTFNRDIAPILYNHCANCHRPGEVAPFSLLTYSDASKRAAQIAAVTHARFMPPWKPVVGYNEFADDRHLDPAEIETLSRWAKAGAPEGDAHALPVPPTFSSDWSLGPPDVVVTLPHPFQIPAGGQDIYQCFVLPLGFADDRAVSAVEVRPGDRQVVHHAILYLDNSGRARELEQNTAGAGYRCFGGPGFLPSGSLGGWAPGAVTQRLPDGVARHVAAGADLVAQIHYHPSGKPEQDQTSIGIYFAKGPAPQSIYNVTLIRRDLDIPAGDANYRVRVDFTLPIGIQATGVTPHMHLLGKQMKVTATLPTGEIKPLIRIDDWDFNWQGIYTFKSPIWLPAGTKLEMEALYDNSAANARNPHSPPQEVHWGENTTDEMAIAFLQYESANPADRVTIGRALIHQLGLRRPQ